MSNWKTKLQQARAHRQTLKTQDETETSLAPEHRELRYAVNPAASSALGDFVLEVTNQDWQAYRVDEASITALPDPLDRHLLSLATFSQELSASGKLENTKTQHIVLPHHAHHSLIQSLCEKGRLGIHLTGGTHPLQWDNDPWQFKCELLAETDDYLFRGLIRRGEASLPVDQVQLFSQSGLMVRDKTVGLFGDASHFNWLSILREDNGLRIAKSEIHDFMREVYETGAPPIDADLPEQLTPTLIEDACVPVLRFKRPKYAYRDQYVAHLTFDYGGREIDPTENQDNEVVIEEVDQETGEATVQRYQRDFKTEKAAIDQLEQRPFLMDIDYDLHDLRPHIRGRDLIDTLRRLGEANWRLSVEKTEIVAVTGTDVIRVKSEHDWFELNAVLKLGDLNVPFPELLKVVREGEKTIEIEGQIGVLPEKLHDRLRALSQFGDLESGKVRIRRSQLGLLDLLLSRHTTIDGDTEFRLWRKGLEDFKGIEPLQPEDGFMGELRPYQQMGLGWMVFLQTMGLGGCLADDMGLGKTVMMLAMLHRLYARAKKGNSIALPSLVVVPRSLVTNWEKEAERFTPDLKVLDISGTRKSYDFEQIKEADLVIATYATMRRDNQELKEQPFEYAILDEAQTIKNTNSATTRAAGRLNARQRLALTGTPLENHIGELWSIIEFINPGMLGTLPAFKKFTRKITPEQYKDIARIISPIMLRRTKQEVAKDLPARTEVTVHCEMSKEQAKHYKSLRDHYRSVLLKKVDTEGLNKARFHVLEALLRLRQAACHPALINQQYADMKTGKLEMLLEQLKEALDENHKCLIFSQFTSMLEIVGNALKANDLNYLYLDGKTRNRGELVDQFQTDPKARLFLISLKAGGTGLTLTAADHVFILDPWWNPAVEAQAIDRAHRIGQAKPVIARRLISVGTVEEKILNMQASKRELADAIITSNGNSLSNLTREDLEMLLK